MISDKKTKKPTKQNKTKTNLLPKVMLLNKTADQDISDISHLSTENFYKILRPNITQARLNFKCYRLGRPYQIFIHKVIK